MQQFLNRHAFPLTIGVFVISSSFLYGISAGLAKRADRFAVASLSPFDDWSPAESRIQVPEDVTVVPLGREMEINGKAAEAVSFVTDRGIKDLFREQVGRWESKGAKVIGVATARRGFAVGFNEETGERFSMSASLLPSVLGEMVASGHSVQGFISVVDMGRRDGESGEVPGVPILGGGQGGTVVSSLDRGGRSHTGVYTIPGSVEAVADLYREELVARGWRLVEDGALGERARGLAGAVGSLRFVQRGEEIVLLLSPGKTGAGKAAQTVAMVSKAPVSDARLVR